VTKITTLPIAIIAISLTMFAGEAISAQDKYTVQVPNGLAFSEFRGFEDWRVVSVSQSGDEMKVILSNPVMINAYRAGITGGNKPFPDGAMLAKIHWITKKSTEAPSPTTVPDFLHDIDFMERDRKRFAATGNWGTRSSITTSRQMHSPPWVAARLVDTRATTSLEQRITFSPPTEKGERNRYRGRLAAAHTN
jgi:hypothetical protein